MGREIFEQKCSVFLLMTHAAHRVLKNRPVIAVKIANLGSPTRLFTRIIAIHMAIMIFNKTKFLAPLCTTKNLSVNSWLRPCILMVLYNLLMIMMGIISSLVHIIDCFCV